MRLRAWWPLALAAACAPEPVEVFVDLSFPGEAPKAMVVAIETPTDFEVHVVDPEDPDFVERYSGFKGPYPLTVTAFLYDKTAAELKMTLGPVVPDSGALAVGVQPTERTFQWKVDREELGTWTPVAAPSARIQEFKSSALGRPPCERFGVRSADVHSLPTAEPPIAAFPYRREGAIVSTGNGTDLWLVRPSGVEKLTDTVPGFFDTIGRGAVRSMVPYRGDQLLVASGDRVYVGTLDDGFAPLPALPPELEGSGSLDIIFASPDARSLFALRLSGSLYEIGLDPIGDAWTLVHANMVERASLNAFPASMGWADDSNFVLLRGGPTATAQIMLVSRTSYRELPLPRPMAQPGEPNTLLYWNLAGTEAGVVVIADYDSGAYLYALTPDRAWKNLGQVNAQSPRVLTPFRDGFLFAGRWGWMQQYTRGDFCPSNDGLGAADQVFEMLVPIDPIADRFFLTGRYFNSGRGNPIYTTFVTPQ